MEATQTTYIQEEKLNKASAIAYTIGGAGAGASFFMINNYLMLFYTDVVGLSAAAISLIMLVARIWDAVNDPMMGVIADRTRTRFGKFRPWLMIGPPFLALFNILTFTAWPLHGTAKAVVCAICYIGAGMAYTVVQVAVNGLVNRLTNNPQHKMTIIAMSQIGNQIISTILSGVMMTAVLYFSKDNVANGTGYFKTTVIISVITCALVWVAAWKCKEIKTPEEERMEENHEKIPLSKSLKGLVKNDQLMYAIISVFMASMGAIARASMLSYYLIYVAGSYTLIAPVMAMQPLGQMIGNIPLPWLTKKLGKKRWFLISNYAQIGVMVLWFFMPAHSSAAVLMGLSFVIGLLGAATSCTYAFVCDCVEYGDMKYGVRDDGLAFSAMSFMVKLASAITGSAGALLLTAVGYVANAEQSASTLTGINVIVNIVPAVIMAVGLLPVVFGYKLTDKKMEEVNRVLKERRSRS
ncbi:MAG: glycoside-pentoside-hexuronide (GPH):cation symporter [Faecalicatena sp.]|uniref:MFS transporter n=1 Tax=Faecalicatena sp. TaxID=2005360 RepID=UPI00258D526D|nr:glycoside-pentoside-hexuronide (GPH):cation symporter [Faecalicatena sp.]MCI6465687.1 glycoside-pentoside-hexuronide (GPH):cation symporter [Faecalicatena sp.]MDY5618038.1 glycoside-pentoside-hexuronide (GPH):cation symporter [Lachnospiraceae bacterium]